MISRQIGATLSVVQRAGVARLQRRRSPAASRSGRNAGEPSARLSSPIAVATSARRLSRPSSSRSIASMRPRSDSRSAAGGGDDAGIRPPLLAGRPGRRRPTPVQRPGAPAGRNAEDGADPAVERHQLRVDGRAGISATSFWHEVVAQLGRRRWYFLAVGDSSQAISCFSSSSVIFASKSGADRRRRELERAIANERVGLVDVLLDLGLDRLRPAASRFSCGADLAAASPGRPRCIICAAGRSTTLRAKLSMSLCCRRSRRWTSSFLAGEAGGRRRGLCAAARAPASAERRQGDQRRAIRRFMRLLRRSARCRPRRRRSPASSLASFSTIRCRPVSLRRRRARSASRLGWRGRARGSRRRGCARARRCR